jgi:hypothetical protein
VFIDIMGKNYSSYTEEELDEFDEDGDDLDRNYKINKIRTKGLKAKSHFTEKTKEKYDKKTRDHRQL